MCGNLNFAKQSNEGRFSIGNMLTSPSLPRSVDRFSTAASISIYPFSKRENSRSETKVAD